jgi:hypothetical protein
MLAQLLSAMTPELIINAVKANPKIIIETLQKFETFKLLGAALNTDKQVLLSNNAGLINDFLKSNAGVAAIQLWMDEFSEFVNKVNKIKEAPRPETKEELEARVRAEVRAELGLK